VAVAGPKIVPFGKNMIELAICTYPLRPDCRDKMKKSLRNEFMNKYCVYTEFIFELCSDSLLSIVIGGNSNTQTVKSGCVRKMENFHIDIASIQPEVLRFGLYIISIKMRCVNLLHLPTPETKKLDNGNWEARHLFIPKMQSGTNVMTANHSKSCNE